MNVALINVIKTGSFKNDNYNHFPILMKSYIQTMANGSQNPRDRAQLWFLISVALLVLVMQIMSTMGVSQIQYHREAILAGEYWRLISGHFLHVTWLHMIINLLGLGLIWGLFKDLLYPKTWWLLLGGSIAGIDIGLMICQPHIIWYAGFSGALHGLFAGGAICALVRYGKRRGILLGLLLGKLLYEQLIGPLPGTVEMSGAPVITEAHLYGAIGGSMMALMILGFRKVKKHGLNYTQ